MPRPRPLVLRASASSLQPSICRSCIQLPLRNVRPMHSKTAARKDVEAADWAKQAERIAAGKEKSMLDILTERGYIKDIAGSRSALDALLTSKRTAAYAGIDPTAPSLHLGHLLPFMIIFWLYIHGYHSITLIGGATAKVGDPTGRLSDRQTMDSSTRLTNLTAMNAQVRGLWKNVANLANKHGYKRDLSWKRDIWNNSTWLSKLTMVDFLGVLGRGARMGTMMGRDTVKNKMASGDGMSFAEFTYPLLQAWDWWHMYSQHNVQLQIGGSDQYGNIVAGMDAIKYIAGSEAGQHGEKEIDPMKAPYGITVPLLTTSSGIKFGKSAGNAVWLDPTMTSPFDLYGFLLRTSDADVARYLSLFTFMPLSKIAETMTAHSAQPGRRIAQHLLAREVLDLVHGGQVSSQTVQQHRDMRKPTLSSISASSHSSIATPSSTETIESANGEATQLISNPKNPSSIERIALPSSLVVSTSPPRLLHAAGLAPTRSAAARLIASGGAYIGANTTWHSDSPMNDSELTFRPLSTVTHGMIDGYVAQTGVVVLRVGKWKVRVVEVIADDEFEKQGLSAPGWDDFVRQRDGVEKALEIVSGKQAKKAQKHGNWKQEPRGVKGNKIDGAEGAKEEAIKEVKKEAKKEAREKPKEKIKEKTKEVAKEKSKESTENSNVRDLAEDASNPAETKWRGIEDMFRKINKP